MKKPMILVASLLFSMGATAHANQGDMASHGLMQPSMPLTASQHALAGEMIWLSRASNRAFDPRRKQRLTQESTALAGEGGVSLPLDKDVASTDCRRQLKLQHRPYRKVNFVDSDHCQTENGAAHSASGSSLAAR